MKTLGVVLVALGIIALVFGGIGYSSQRTIIDMGPIQATATEHHDVPISPIAGGVAIFSGLIIIVAPRKKAA